MGKEEYAIAKNRSTGCTAKLITVKGTGLSAGKIEILPCIERGVPDKLEKLTVKMVTPHP